MVLIVTGVFGLVMLAAAAVWMGVLARRDPNREFTVRRSRFGPRAGVTYAQWLRLVRWPVAIMLLSIVMGYLTLRHD